MVGDFNKVMFSFEKKGGRRREERQMKAFGDALEDYQLHDLRFQEAWFTWERGKLSENNIRERLEEGWLA